MKISKKDSRKKWLIIHEFYCRKKKERQKISKKRNRSKQDENVLIAPKIMSLSQNLYEVVSFFNKLREKSTSAEVCKYLRVDFTNIISLKPGAALVLASELYRWQETNDVNLKPYKVKKWDNEIKRLFQEMGLFELLHIPKKYRWKARIQAGSQTFFKFLTGTLSDGKLANQLMESMHPVIGPHYNEPLLYIALSEAMTNVIQHAYPQDSQLFCTNLKNRWWLSGSFDNSTGVMSVLLFDQGVGIPSTLPKQDFFKKVLSFLNEKGFSKDNDGHLIQAALEIGKSRTKQNHRGKGLKQILNFSADNDFGSLYIVSRKGEYRYQEDKTELIESHSVEIGGTFIQWNIKLM